MMFEISRGEKEQLLDSVDYFEDKFFECRCGEVLVKALAEFIQAKIPDANIVWNDAFYYDKEEFREVLKKIFRLMATMDDK